MPAAPALRLFLYGTLRAPDANPIAAALHERLLPGIPGWVDGALYALPDPHGWYPALIPGAGPGRVHGLVCTARPDFAASDLARIDAYEDCHPAAPERSEYLRRLLPVFGPTSDPGFGSDSNGPPAAFAYCYNRPVPVGAQPIPEGDFAAWLAAAGRPAYAPPC